MMWNFLKKWLSPKQVYPAVEAEYDAVIVGNSAEVVILGAHPDNLHDDGNYQNYYYVDPSLSKFEKSLLRLRSYDGHIRQAILEDLKECFDPELFPHLLWRLNDCVEINRQLAIDHVQRWAVRPEFLVVCTQYFFDITALQKRLRVNPEIFHLLLDSIGKNKLYLMENLTQKQGRLPRVILAFASEYQWLEDDELMHLCEQANDQLVRKYWLDKIMQSASEQQLVSILKNTQQKDVQYTLFNSLWDKNVFTISDLIQFWHSPYWAVMDYADFALRQKYFDFDQYFQEHSIQNLSQKSLRLRGYQWVIRQGSQTEFFNIIQALDNNVIANAVMKFALKRKYVNFEQIVSYYHRTEQNLTFIVFSKIRQISGQQLSLHEIESFIDLMDEPVSLLQRLELATGYNLWEQLYWYVLQWDFIHNADEQIIYDDFVQRQLWHLNYVIYPPHWQPQQKQNLERVLPKLIQRYPDIFSGQNVLKILNQTLNGVS